ncbi:FAD-dependent monooxygenase [Actinopolymorpha pittospori]|uniref:2-polyprenyl-6-methoxyphenol hydroxylase-like FAD-dependent oxidoreductase n=1 Tax=Actinopolymorpha pittospori TaxID=648752 RepID=A0A927RH79_9ACTN|nr:FAD-dependent monooxygenase [Actinopolymorpha pittospori]MBE1611925.1 2-polyprenyl-6-methoxyphenol hydroxylase-like FAD-dependent oxidoreductase [Actinopolymorpha pittospori]
MARRRAVVVGAGVGGLAAAGALVRDGWSVTLLEHGAEVRATGSALALWPNALRALEALDPNLGVHLRARDAMRGMVGLRTSDGRWLTRVTAGSESAGAGSGGGLTASPLMVTRAALHEALRALVPAESLRVGRTVTAVDQRGVEAVVHAHGDAGPEEYPADLVVAADGVRSALRPAVDPRPAVRSAGYVTWRGLISPDLAPALESGSETWGRGQRFGFLQLGSGGIYWYATLAHADPRYRPEEFDAARRRDRLVELFASWHDPVGRVLAATPPERIIRNDVELLWPLPRTFVAGRLALLGDAAHAMTPDLGQGACLALEDAVELATVLRAAAVADVPAGLPRYDRLRRARTTGLARQARLLGRIGQLRHPWVAAVRDRLISVVPANGAARSLTAATDWQPTATTSAR